MIDKNGYIIVEKGDTLSGIAAKLGKSVRELMALNPSLKSADTIRAGQQLRSATQLRPPEPPSSLPDASTTQETPAPTAREKVSKVLEETPNEPVSTTQDAECCCNLDKLQIIQPKRGADSEGKGGSTYKMDVVKLQEKKNVAKPTNKEKGTFELYITAPPFKSDGTPDTKSLSFPHAFHKPKCDLALQLKSKRMDKIAKDKIEIDSYALIKGAVDRKPPKGVLGFMRDWNLTKLLKLATATEGLYETYDLIATGSSKCAKDPLATLYVAKPLKLDGELKFGYTGEYDVKNTGLLSEWEALAKSKTEGKLTLTFLRDSYEFSGEHTTGLNIPKGGKGAIHTVKAKELFENFAKWFDPIYSIAHLATSSPKKSLKEAKAHLKKTLKEQFGTLESIQNHKTESTLGTTTFSLKAADFQYSENPNDYTLAPTGSIEFGLNLFDGSQLRIDMIPAITASVDALNEVISAATHRNIKGKIKADLILQGGINGTCKLEAKAGTLKADKSATIGGELGIIIDAKIEAEAKWLFLYAKIGAYATLASEKDIEAAAGIKGEMTFAAPKKPGDPIGFDGDVLCTGATIYLGVYAELKDDDKAKAGTDTAGGGVADFPENTQPPAQNTASHEEGLKVERSCDFVILHEFSFKEVLLHNKQAPELTQYPHSATPVALQGDMILDEHGGIYGTMDNDATMPSMDHFLKES